MDRDDAEKRIAELERQLAEQKRIAELERQIADAKETAHGQSVPTPTPLESGMSPPQFNSVDSQGLRQAQLGRQFGVRDQSGYPTGSADSRLSPAPRRIPMAFWVAELLPFRWWYIWILLMLGFVPIEVWVHSRAVFPMVFPIVVVLAFVGIYTFQLLGTAKRFALLKWGQVAQVTGTQIVSRGTYYSGTTWGMAPLPVAHGWKVERPFFSGPNTKTLIRYKLNGAQGQLKISGRQYHDGVVLADPRSSARALCVTSFSYDLDRDESGNWIGRIRPRLMLGMAVWSIVLIGALTLATASLAATAR
jgi:hypothetical protein